MGEKKGSGPLGVLCLLTFGGGGPTTCAIQRLKEKRKEMDEHRDLILPGFLRLSEGVREVLCLIRSKMQCPPPLLFQCLQSQNAFCN